MFPDHSHHQLLPGTHCCTPAVLLLVFLFDQKGCPGILVGGVLLCILLQQIQLSHCTHRGTGKPTLVVPARRPAPISAAPTLVSNCQSAVHSVLIFITAHVSTLPKRMHIIHMNILLTISATTKQCKLYYSCRHFIANCYCIQLASCLVRNGM